MNEIAIDDIDLVRQAKKGNFDAFEELVGRYEKQLYSICMGITRNPQDTEDVVQTTFTNVIEKLDSFREESSFYTWLYRIAANNAYKLLRRKSNTPELSLDTSGDTDGTGSIPHPEYIARWCANPARTIERMEQSRILRETIEALPDNYRIVFILRDIEGLSVEETSAVLEISKANVKVRLLRARLALREKLTKAFGKDTDRVYPDHDHDHDSDSVPAQDVLESYKKYYGDTTYEV